MQQLTQPFIRREKKLKKTVGVVGLGYVGLPLAVEFGKVMPTVGYDLSAEKINHYRNFFDPTGEVSAENLKSSTHLQVTNDVSKLSDADLIVVAVPTPVTMRACLILARSLALAAPLARI